MPKYGVSTSRLDLKPHHIDRSGRRVFHTLGHRMFRDLTDRATTLRQFSRLNQIPVATINNLRCRTQFPSFATAYHLELFCSIPMRSWFEPERSE